MNAKEVNNMAKVNNDKIEKIIESAKRKDIIKPNTYRFLSLEERFSKIIILVLFF